MLKVVMVFLIIMATIVMGTFKMFWSGEKLKDKRRQLIDFDSPDQTKEVDIDCASFVLTVGSEVFITPNKESDSRTKQTLTTEKSQIIIPKGQFALVMTEEIVKVPSNAIAFISFKAKYKYKGLINVSGFHVDPGWNGRLTFSVYNAGPQDILLEKGSPFALIWYADLSEESQSIYQKPQVKHLNPEHISGMIGDIFSPFKLQQEIQDLKEQHNKDILALKEEMHKSEGRLMARHVLLVFGVISYIFMLIRFFNPQ